MSIIYSKMEGKNDPLYGKFEHPIKMLIESESDIQSKKNWLVDALFNVEKSTRYAETIMGESDFGTFQSVKEGQGAENDSVEKTYAKTISHIAFMKEFTITKEMADDAKFGFGTELSSKPKKLVRAYYRTRNELAEQALINGTATSFVYNKATVDTSTGDGLALFSKVHTNSLGGATQSNYFSSGNANTALCAAATIEALFNKMANKIRNFKDENGNVMGYIADTVIIPGNRPELEALVKKTVGSERTVGSGNNDINTQYGNWTVVVLDGWQTADDRLMFMSSAANEELCANMFFNRHPLDITSTVDYHTRNNIWNAYCRMGIGFTTWKHIALYVDASTAGTTL